MGQYTAYWERYKKESLKGTLYALLMFGVALPIAAAVGYVLEPLDTLDTVVLLSLLVAWLVAFTLLLLRFSKVTCPRCATRYSRGKYLVNCPKCNLRMLQEDP